jgi:predicted RNA-binding protein with TRAM domain
VADDLVVCRAKKRHTTLIFVLQQNGIALVRNWVGAIREVGEGMVGELLQGEMYDIDIRAKNMRGEGIGTVNGMVVFVKNAKTRIGKAYKVKVTDVYRTFAYAEVMGEKGKYFIGNGSLIVD